MRKIILFLAIVTILAGCTSTTDDGVAACPSWSGSTGQCNTRIWKDIITSDTNVGDIGKWDAMQITFLDNRLVVEFEGVDAKMGDGKAIESSPALLEAGTYTFRALKNSAPAPKLKFTILNDKKVNFIAQFVEQKEVIAK